MMERRLFMQALAASVVAAGASLPVGFPTELKEHPFYLNLENFAAYLNDGGPTVVMRFDRNGDLISIP